MSVQNNSDEPHYAEVRSQVDAITQEISILKANARNTMLESILMRQIEVCNKEVLATSRQLDEIEANGDVSRRENLRFLLGNLQTLDAEIKRLNRELSTLN